MNLRQISLTNQQLDIINRPITESIFLEGFAGCGKTTVGMERMGVLLSSGISPDSIFILVPQRSLGEPYLKKFYELRLPTIGTIRIFTVGGLARQMVDLFWPIIAQQAGFHKIDTPPIYLTMETSQYLMGGIVNPLINAGYFDGVTISRSRLFSQIIDNLNKAALVGFSHTEISTKLKSSWSGEIGQLKVYDEVQECVNLFREYCIANNFLDYSLQIEVFFRYLWPSELFQKYFYQRYKHLIVDNIEEDTPIASDLVSTWINVFDSSLVICDKGGGYRKFLGADPILAYSLKRRCSINESFSRNFVSSSSIEQLRHKLMQVMVNGDELESDYDQGDGNDEEHKNITTVDGATADRHNHQSIILADFKFVPEMLDWVVNEIKHLVDEHKVPLNEIVVLAPYMSDAFRYGLLSRLEKNYLPVRSHRPSRPLKDEPEVQCLLTLGAIAHPEWGFQPTKADFMNALVQTIDGLDFIRAQILTEIVYRVKRGRISLTSFNRINLEMQDRITREFGRKYDRLRQWMDEYQENHRHNPLQSFDYFLATLFGEVLTQPGFAFNGIYSKGEITANLIESIKKFQIIFDRDISTIGSHLGAEYLKMIRDGTIAAQYLRSWTDSDKDAILISPAHTFLIRNQAVDFQFWLDIGSRGWYQRLNQPLTQPYILSREWDEGKSWTDENEVIAGQENLKSLVSGLLRRCRRKIYFCFSDLGEQGYEQRGSLLRSIQKIL